LKLISAIVQGLSFASPIALPSGKGRGGAKLDPMLWGFIVRLETFFERIGQRVIQIVGLIENEEYDALTGQKGMHGVYISDGESIIGPLGVPSLGKIMTHLELGMDDIALLAPTADNPDFPDIASAWNRNGVDANGYPDRCVVRTELVKMLKHYQRAFMEKGNPFDVFQTGDENESPSES
jgi:hypothetical protein